MTPHYGLYFGCEQRSCCQIVLEMWKKIHMLICNHWVTTKRASTVSMHFLDPKIPVLGGMQKQASKLCILTWYGSNYGQFWILQTEANVQFFKLKLMTKIEFNFSNIFQYFHFFTFNFDYSLPQKFKCNICVVLTSDPLKAIVVPNAKHEGYNWSF